MEFRNATPFPALAYDGVDPLGRSFHVAVLRITYALRPVEPVSDGGHFTHRLVFQEAHTPLATEDAFHGDPRASSPKWENDLAPYKPKCDVLILGEAHAPGGDATGRFPAGLTLRGRDLPMPLPEPPSGLNPLMDPSDTAISRYEELVERCSRETIPGKVLVEQKVVVQGPRVFRRKSRIIRFFWFLARLGSLGTLHRNPWKLTSPERISSLPLRYEFAYGGGAPAECPWNPLGRGYIAPGCGKFREIPAPQIEAEGAPLTAKLFWKTLQGQADTLEHPALRPAGFGPIGRHWAPRRLLGGEPAAQWLQGGPSFLPQGFDPAHWNCAPPALQCEYPDGNEVFTLINLLPCTEPGVVKDGEGNTVARFALPGHKPFLHARFGSGGIGRLPLRTDTLILDLDTRQVVQVLRAIVMKTHPLRTMEVRMEASETESEARTEAELCCV